VDESIARPRLACRYRLHDKRLPGRPDLVFPRYRTVLFVHGCFWHQHPGCRLASTPDTNAEFWQHKLSSNQMRDARHTESLQTAGWTVLVIWECQVHDPSGLPAQIRGPVSP
jgi:DNA mismatch endonuclease, patch repair protein